MNVNFEKLDNVNGEITVTVDGNDYAEKVSKQLKEIGRSHAEPGFRPGKVPAGLIAKKYGKSVKYDVINNLIGEAVFDYIKENKLQVLGQPVPVADNDFNIDNDEFTFKFKVGLAPEIDTHVNKDLHVPFYTIKVSEEMVDEQVEALRQRFGRQVSGEETDSNCVIKGVITELDENGNPKADGIVVENGIIAPVHFKDEEQKKLFENKKVGDSVVYNPAATCDANAVEMSSMLNIDKNEVDDHKGDFSFEIKDIIVLKPSELDQEFFDNAVGKDKVHNEEELREELKKLLAMNLEGDSNYKFSIDAKDEILKAVGNLELPERILKDFLLSRNKELNADNIDAEFDSMRGSLTWDLVRDAIGSQFGVEVNEEDLLNQARGVVVRQLMQYGSTQLPDELIDKYANEVLKEEKSRDMISQQVYEGKVFAAIKANVTLDGKEVTVEEFQKLFAPAE